MEIPRQKLEMYEQLRKYVVHRRRNKLGRGPRIGAKSVVTWRELYRGT
jgi:hypothetical protein